MTEQSIPNHQEKIKRVAGRLKIAVWVFCGIVATVFVVGLFYENPSVQLDTDWMGEEAALALSASSLFPTALFAGIAKFELLLVGFFMFWLQRLLALFERGEYFSNQSVNCCLWLAWLFVSLLVVPAMQKGYLYYLCHRFLPDTEQPGKVVHGQWESR